MTHALYIAAKAVWHSQLLGVLVGIYATRQWQARQWRLESTKAEYRELLSTLSRSAYFILNNSPRFFVPPTTYTHEQVRLSEEADMEARIAIQDRIFIANRMLHDRVLEQWQLMGACGDMSEYWMRWRDLHDKLVAAAHADLDIRHRRFFHRARAAFTAIFRH